MRVVAVVGSGLFAERVEDAVFRTGDERPIKDNCDLVEQFRLFIKMKNSQI